MNRQTVLREYSHPFQYKVSQSHSKGKKHLVHEDDLTGSAGETYCGRWEVSCTEMRDALTVLNAARNMCSMCNRRLEKSELVTLATMASACSQHEITADEI